MFSTLKLLFTILLAAIFGAGPSTPVVSTTPAPAAPAISEGPSAPHLHTMAFQTYARAPRSTESLKLEASELSKRLATVHYKVCSHTAGSRLIVVCPPPAILR